MESRKIKWQKTSLTTWQTANSQRQGGYTGQITYTGGAANPYQLLINPGSIASSWPTLKNAKNQFRLFLLDKPPIF